jgi:hypothetical protein
VDWHVDYLEEEEEEESDKVDKAHQQQSTDSSSTKTRSITNPWIMMFIPV